MINDSALYAPWMAKLIYSALTSLDGYVSDEDGNFDWAAPSEEVHAFTNDLERSIGTHLYGRRMYETMVYWETAHTLPESSPVELDYAEVWQSAEKIIYSTTMDQVSSARTWIERDFDPDSIRQLTQSADRDLSVGGAELAAQAIKAGLVDEYHLFLIPSWSGAAPQHCRTTSALTSNWSMNIVSQTASSTFTIESPPPSLSLAEFAAQRRTMSLPSSALCGKTQPDLTEIPSICGLVRKDAAGPGRIPFHLRPCAERRSPTRPSTIAMTRTNGAVLDLE